MVMAKWLCDWCVETGKWSSDTTSRVKSMRNTLLVWQPPAAHTLSGRLGASQVKSMQLEATLYSEQFYAQNILLCLGTINIFKIILPSPLNYSKKKTIQIYSSVVFVLESLL